MRIILEIRSRLCCNRGMREASHTVLSPPAGRFLFLAVTTLLIGARAESLSTNSAVNLIINSPSDAYKEVRSEETNTFGVDSASTKELEEAAENGSEAAQLKLGMQYKRQLYLPGEGGAPIFSQAARYFRMAAVGGSAQGQLHLGELYLVRANQHRGLDENLQRYESVIPGEDLTDAARKELAEYSTKLFEGPYGSVASVPTIYEDFDEAAKWLRKAAEQGNAKAQNELGHLYQLGDGVRRDLREAAKWFRLSAEQNNDGGQFLLGLCYEKGEGVLQDFIEAYKWFCLAAVERGNLSHSLDRLAAKMTPEQIVEAQRRASVFIAKKGPGDLRPKSAASEAPSPQATGSGFFITGNGYFLTCFHVVQDATSVKLRTKLGSFPAKLLTVDRANDVALLKAEGTFQALPIIPSKNVKLGQPVLTVGFPNVELQGFSPKLAKGEIAGLSGAQDDPKYFQISVPVQPGNSGGALVDDHGNVVGLVAAKLSRAAAVAMSGAVPENVNYAMKSSFLLSFLEAMPEVSAKLKEPKTEDSKLEDLVTSIERATVLVLVY